MSSGYQYLYEIVIWKTIAAAERFYDVRTGARLISRTLEWTENYPRKLTIQLDNKTSTATGNFVSASFAGWDAAAVGAVDVGDKIKYSVYMDSNPTVATVVFWGIITEVSQTSGGILTIVAKDWLEKFEYLQPSTIVYKNYRDGLPKETTEGAGAVSIDGCTETGIVWPPVFVGLARTDIRVASVIPGTMHGILLMDVSTTYYNRAQSFVAMGDGLIGVEYYCIYQNLTTGGHLHCQIQTDASGIPSGMVLAEEDFTVPTGSTPGGTEYRQMDFAPAGHTVPLEKGIRYWIVWSCDAAIQGDFLSVGGHDELAGDETTDHYFSKTLPAGAWTESAAGWNIYTNIDFANYEEVPLEDYYQSGTTIVCRTQGTPITTVDAYYTIHRAKVSYYYGTVTTEEIFTKLLTSGLADTYTVDSDCDTTYTLYQTRGKSVGECLRELCDTFETTGARSGKQHIIAAYRSGGLDVIKVGFRNNDTGRTFSHGADSTTDDELRIASVNLKRTVNLRPASVVVIGKAASGGPIIVQRDDRALATSFRTKSKMNLTTTLTDESINTLAEADRKAWQILDSCTRGTWEGSITVAGVFPDVFDLNTASESYGAGGHIDLNYSPLGIVSEEFHVKGIVLHENTTEIQITNEDILLTNALTETRGRAERSESFIAPDDPFTTVFVSGYYDAVEAAATMYMQLCVWDETPIDDHTRVLCTRTTNSRYNDVTYHAEFETHNGHTLDGDEVYQIELWDAVTGGYHHAKVTLTFSEQFPKWRTTRVIAEIHCKAA
jgi:hypothetical protein